MVASPLLDDIADLRVFALHRRRVLRDEINLACHWADTHPWLGDLTADPEDQPDVMGLAGVGTPRVELSSIAEFAAVLGVSTKAGQKLIGEALELRHRLPAIWAPRRSTRHRIDIPEISRHAYPLPRNGRSHPVGKWI